MVKALREGNAFGAEIYMGDWETFEDKAKNARSIPVLNSVVLKGDTLKVSVTGRPYNINFIGQNGKSRKITHFANEAWYKFQPDDTYIRTKITFITYFDYPKVGPGTLFYLNPVFRYNGGKPVNTLVAEVNIFKSWVVRIIGFGALIALVLVWIYFRRKYKKTL